MDKMKAWVWVVIFDGTWQIITNKINWQFYEHKGKKTGIIAMLPLVVIDFKH